MSVTSKNDEWRNIVDTTYEVVKDRIGRGSAFDKTLAKVLGVSAFYLVWLFFILSISKENHENVPQLAFYSETIRKKTICVLCNPIYYFIVW